MKTKTKALSLVALVLLIVLGIGAYTTGSLSSLQGKFSTGTTITSATMATAAETQNQLAKTYMEDALKCQTDAKSASERKDVSGLNTAQACAKTAYENCRDSQADTDPMNTYICMVTSNEADVISSSTLHDANPTDKELSAARTMAITEYTDDLLRTFGQYKVERTAYEEALDTYENYIASKEHKDAKAARDEAKTYSSQAADYSRTASGYLLGTKLLQR